MSAVTNKQSTNYDIIFLMRNLHEKVIEKK